MKLKLSILDQTPIRRGKQCSERKGKASLKKHLRIIVPSNSLRSLRLYITFIRYTLYLYSPISYFPCFPISSRPYTRIPLKSLTLPPENDSNYGPCRTGNA